MRAWLVRAEGDLALARHARTLAPEHGWAAAFHAQQAVEKSLKAYLVLVQREFPYTHEIDTLIQLCGSPIASQQDVASAATLTGFAVAARYPGVAPAPHQAAEAVLIAERAVVAIRATIVAEGGPRVP